MFAADSPLLEIDHRRENIIIPHYTAATVGIRVVDIDKNFRYL